MSGVISQSAFEHCELCPRRCGVDRRTLIHGIPKSPGTDNSQTTEAPATNPKPTLGFCGQSERVKVARAALHMWEEPCISGAEGSGTVFFTGCTLGCVYCQNRDISARNAESGKYVDAHRLAEIYTELEAKGANNINLVTPTMFSPIIHSSIELSRELGLTIPFLYNTSGYELPEVIDALSDKIDIWLPDFKYLSGELASKYSAAGDYPEYAKASLAVMVKRCGECSFDSRGMMTRGVIVRQLLLPGQLRESMRVLEYLYKEYGNSIYYSLMSQYTPTKSLDKGSFPELARRVTTYEYCKLIDFALSLGITNAFIQEREAAAESFIPAFNGEGV